MLHLLLIFNIAVINNIIGDCIIRMYNAFIIFGNSSIISFIICTIQCPMELMKHETCKGNNGFMEIVHAHCLSLMELLGLQYL